ncbi:hypothetical protein EU546_02970 [Candidatus Thorarchaeota archaeon]|nr:MAG: hypothetical protein EU546_02970 [Candidatus Thorarchaeota archaeon]
MLSSDRLEELVKIDTHSVIFPQTCPVCGAPATVTSFVTMKAPEVVKETKNYRRSRKNTHAVKETRRGLLVPACERHAEESLQEDRIKSIVTLFAGISIILLTFSGASIAFRVLDHGIPRIFMLAVFGISSLLAAFSLRALGPNRLDRAIRILDIDSQAIAVLRIRNRQYLSELLRLNPQAMRPVALRDRTGSSSKPEDT